uniref:Uncharacterized protein n=1 Tax=Rhabditophanes sp. KR3021 TaxID=114890 RepID=A0AC35TK18_9BILA
MEHVNRGDSLHHHEMGHGGNPFLKSKIFGMSESGDKKIVTPSSGDLHCLLGTAKRNHTEKAIADHQKKEKWEPFFKLYNHEIDCSSALPLPCTLDDTVPEEFLCNFNIPGHEYEFKYVDTKYHLRNIEQYWKNKYKCTSHEIKQRASEADQTSDSSEMDTFDSGIWEDQHIEIPSFGDIDILECDNEFDDGIGLDFASLY